MCFCKTIIIRKATIACVSATGAPLWQHLSKEHIGSDIGSTYFLCYMLSKEQAGCVRGTDTVLSWGLSAFVGVCHGLVGSAPGVGRRALMCAYPGYRSLGFWDGSMSQPSPWPCTCHRFTLGADGSRYIPLDHVCRDVIGRGWSGLRSCLNLTPSPIHKKRLGPA